MAKMLGENGYQVTMWVYEPELTEQINATRENATFLPGIELPPSLRATSSLADALDGARLVLSVTPSQVLRTVWQQAVAHLHREAIVVCLSKGIEVATSQLMSEVLAEIVPPDGPQRLAFLSGPSFAKEIAVDQPTAVVVGAVDERVAQTVQQALATPSFRLYTTDDVIGVELGGALKNVIAVAVGVAQGLGLGYNSQAALITRGLAEISRLAVHCGANPLTLAGLAGVGDLVLTCTGHLSRNLQVGVRLGRGEPLNEILDSMLMVAEGIQTARSALTLAQRQQVEMPITQMVVEVIRGELQPQSAIKKLMSRKPKAEREF